MTGPARRRPAPRRFGLTQSAPATEPPEGREATVQDVFAAAPGRVVDGSVGAAAGLDPAKVVAALAGAGVTDHLFSVSWARVLPEGRPDRRALDRYRTLAELLRDNGIEPWVQLYQHDLPLSVMMDGGWLTRDTADRFGAYAAVVVDALAGPVRHWVTLSDPAGHLFLGHAAGVEPPGLTLLDDAWPVAHHLLLGHTRALTAIREAGPGHLAGLVNRHAMVRPAEAAGAADRHAALLADVLVNRLFADPVLRGRFPRALAGEFGDLARPGDLELIAAPADFYGVEHVHPLTIAAAPDNRRVPFTMADAEGRNGPLGETGWEIDPDGLSTVLEGLRRLYPAAPPFVVVDSSAAYPPGNAECRANHLRTHLAVTDRPDVLAHFHQSLIDGWEGADGFTRHHGLFEIDASGALVARVNR